MNCITFFDRTKIRYRARGFTLIELMIVVAIVAILALVGYPTYLDQVRKSARKEATGVVLDTAGRMERVRSQKFKYEKIPDQSTSRYTVTVDVPAAAATFTVTATPMNDQVNDDCGVITYTNAGVWSFTKNSVDNCL